MTFRNSVVGGNTLVRAAIQSPNFVTGVSGWTIKRDGSAEFNNVVIRGGVVVSGTALYYNGTPAAGNLFMSISATAGTDSFGNAYVKGMGLYGALGTATAKDTAGNTTILTGALPVNGLLAAKPGVSMNPVTNTGDPASIGALDPGGGADLGLILTSPSPSTGGVPGTDFAQIYMTGPYTSPAPSIALDASKVGGTISLNTVVVTSTATADDLSLLVGGHVNVGSSASTAVFASKAAATTDDLISGRISTDTTNSRFVVNHAGQILWGPGGGTAVDTNLFRSGASVLRTDDSFSVGLSLLVNGVDQGKGLLTQVSRTSNVTFAGTETAILTLPSATYVDGRAYRVKVWGLHQWPTTDNYALYRLRKTNTTGTVYKDQIRIDGVPVAATNSTVQIDTVLTNSSGANVTAAVLLTGIQGSAAQTWTFAASAGNVAYMTVEDIGLASDWPGNAIT